MSTWKVVEMSKKILENGTGYFFIRLVILSMDMSMTKNLLQNNDKKIEKYVSSRWPVSFNSKLHLTYSFTILLS